MKKIALLSIFITGICFTQTGIVTRGPAMGLWFTAARTIECDGCEPAIDLSYDIMTSSGFEIGLGLGIVGDYNSKFGHLTYHINPGGTNFAFGVGTAKTTHDDNSNWESQTDTYEIAMYDNQGFVFGVVHYEANGNDGEVLYVGKYRNVSDRTYLGFTYSINYDTFDAMLEDLEIELLKYGSLSITYGGLF